MSLAALLAVVLIEPLGRRGLIHLGATMLVSDDANNHHRDRDDPQCLHLYPTHSTHLNPPQPTATPLRLGVLSCSVCC